MSNKKFTILAVDDDADLVATVRELLEFEGYAVVTAANGEEGLERLATIRPDAIILDMNMPGMGGIPFLKASEELENATGVPILVFTARANMEEFFDDVPVAGFLSKPCDPDDLLEALEGILAGKTPGSAAGGGESEGDAPGSAIRILLAEDEGGRREVISDALVAAGFEVSVVEDGGQVVERAVVEKPNLVLMRLLMRGMNGDAIAGMLGNIPTTQNTPVVLYDDSGSGPRERGNVGEALLTKRFVKSVEPDDLIKRTREVLHI